ncbi:ABC transporter substrate-binding protein [Virgibacillus halophilus]|uniref:ABC transporter substrate-binding protein n=1 Tax=Tigheibacillus halophilus TaxID=361280 RepID=A0ABU5C2Z3_9BACI|nr:ABC transporter substrate-binding protein [Virgibacillus halophilus]
MKKKKIFTNFSFLLLLMMLFLSACATGNPDSSKNTDDNKKGVTVSFDENIQTLDPHNGSSGNDISVTNTMYESMYTPDQEGELQPLLANDYEKDEDGLNYTFKLRDDVKFTDGTVFNAEAVKTNLDRILESEGSLNSYKSLRDVDKVDVADDYEISITLKNPNSQFLQKIGNLRMISPKALKDDDWDFGKKSAGTGQYVLKKWNHGESIVVEKNKDYWEKGHPKVNKITFRPVPEDGSRVASLKTGESDLIYPVPVNNVDSLKKEDNLDVDVEESTYVNYATLNTSKKPFDDKKSKTGYELCY